MSLTAFATTSYAQRSSTQRTAYNPVNGRVEQDARYRSQAESEARYQAGLQDPSYRAENVGSQVPMANPAIEQTSYYEGEAAYMPFEPACGTEIGCCDTVCGDSICGSMTTRGAVLYAGFEATFVKPHLGSNTAFTISDDTNTTPADTTISQTDFDYDFEFTPRVFLGWSRCGGDVGLRATWWQFDHESNIATGNPPSSGLGSLTHPTFADVDISSVTATDTFSAYTDLNAYTIDLEGVKNTEFCKWQFGVSGGLRYAYAEQGYYATMSDDTATLLDQITYTHSISGIGPTVAIEAYRPLGCRSGTFCKARGSLLFGDNDSSLLAQEDISTTTATTTSTTSSDDILSIYEMQIGYRWQGPIVRYRPWQPFYSVAMEGQMWDGAGNASSQDGTLGFFGLSTRVGVNW
ncbi:Lpg1974 family pore-forming outer membrane protein [Aeoliella mucimassa]|uniref:Lpg1974 family pore-forming outer membrane protein n=1 Tax=Aeoliella mucimassa TaxID=2527972 RepID=UPI0018D2FD1B|nr:Lpg1974 family pore-forming outer membrane protein [Aeoliella mucimassa]